MNAAIARLRTGDISRLDDDFRDVLVHKFLDYFHNFSSEDLMYFECFTLISEVLDSDYSMGLAMWNALQAVTPTGWKNKLEQMKFLSCFEPFSVCKTQAEKLCRHIPLQCHGNIAHTRALLLDSEQWMYH